ncbi:MAG: methyltransferase domain-containing protein [bacterium]|nr:methyltransferase domain-containing protein [bacterium]
MASRSGSSTQPRPDRGEVLDHFTARAGRYDQSSHWCTDPILMERIVSALGPLSEARVLDVACGTGLVSRALKGVARQVAGLDLTPAMYDQALDAVDEFVPGSAEDMPFPDDEFDVVVCRQGVQFMEAERAVGEMVRVARPGGRVCLVNLCAYGLEDRDTYFEILALRNPARRNFFLREDLAALLQRAGCREVELRDHVSREDVDRWSDHGAISEGARERIREIYRSAPLAFTRLHAVESEDGLRYFDDMLFCIAVGRK